MSENGRHAHTLLSQRFSNIPAWEELSDRSRSSLEKVGDTFHQIELLEKQLAELDTQIMAQAEKVEFSLQDELGELEIR